MLGHLVWLIRAQQRNQFAKRLGRLKNPRYALAALFGLAYLFFALGGPGLFRPHDMPVAARRSPLVVFGPIYITLILIFSWLRDGVRGALAFTPAEVNLLFTAPFTQRQLMQYKLLRAQLPLLISALVLAVIGRGSGLPWFMLLLGAWTLSTTVYLHRIGAELVRTNAQQNGLAGWRRARGALLMFAIGVGCLVWSVLAALPEVRAADTAEHAMVILRGAFRTYPARIALAPFDALLGPLLATSAVQWARAMALAVVVLIAHYVWVIRSNTAFLEASAEAGRRVADMMEAARSGKRASLFRAAGKTMKVRAPWFALKPTGEPAVAILWKNVLYFTRSLSLTLPLMLLALVALWSVIGFVEEGFAGGFLVTGFSLLGIAGLIMVVGPLSYRNDFRMDLKNVELLRSLPLHGVRLAAAEVGSSVVAMTLTQWTLVILGSAVIVSTGSQPFVRYAAFYTIPVLLTLPALNALALGFQNALALLYPAWVQLGADTPGGVEFIGQQVMTVFVNLLMRVISLIPPVVIGVLSGALLAIKMGKAGWIPAGVLFVAALYGEAYLLIAWLGREYDGLDLVEAGVL